MSYCLSGDELPPSELISKYSSYQCLKVKSRPTDLCQQTLKSQVLAQLEGTRLHKRLLARLPLGGSAACRHGNKAHQDPGASRDTRTPPHLPPCSYFSVPIPHPPPHSLAQCWACNSSRGLSREGRRRVADTIARKYLVLWQSLVFPLCFSSAWP